MDSGVRPGNGTVPPKVLRELHNTDGYVRCVATAACFRMQGRYPRPSDRWGAAASPR